MVLGIDAETTNAVQKRLLEMAVAISEVFERRDIPYIISFGTLLGAVRHEGFIPWDDDFDFQLFDDTYDQAIEALREDLPHSMFVEDGKSEPLYFHAWAHVKDLGSVAQSEMFPQDNHYVHKGLSIDLYKLKRMMGRELPSYIDQENRAFIERRRIHGLMDDAEYEARIRGAEKLKQSADASVASGRLENVEVFGFPSAYDCKSYKASDVFPLEKYRFEGRWFLGPANSHSILTAIYGDYMSLPPTSERHSHYSSVAFVMRDQGEFYTHPVSQRSSIHDGAC